MEGKSNQSISEQSCVELVKDINKEFGAGAVMSLSDKNALVLDLIPTTILSLDAVLGGGIPKARMIEIFGMPASGKTTLALQIAKEVLSNKGYVLFIDMEQSLNADYIKSLGLVTDKFLFSQPDNGNDALEMADKAIRAGVNLVIIDSVDALVPKQEIEGDFGDANMGAKAKLLAQACRKFQPAARESGTLVLWINQLRDKFGGFAGSHITTGGNALRFYTTQRLELVNIGQMKDGDNIIGNRITVKIVKNKIFPPHKKTELELIFGQGFSKLADLIDQAVNFEIIKKSGAWYSYKDEKIGQGKENVKEHLINDPKLEKELIGLVKEQL